MSKYNFARKQKYELDLKYNLPEKYVLNTIKARANRKVLYCDLSIQDIIIPRFCPIFNIELKINKNYRKDNSISVDRINNNTGYTKNNIIIVSWKANKFKNCASFEEMEKLLYNWDAISTNIDEDYNIKYIKKIYKKVVDRAKSKNMECSITYKDVIIPKYCPILDIKLFPSQKYPTDNSPSIDRIDNSKGYIPNNIRVISRRANTLKGIATKQEYEILVNFYKNLKTNGLP